MVGTCEVANTPEYLVAEPIPAAQEKDSKPAPLKLVTPPKPFQRPTGTSASNCIASASCASVSVLAQSASSTPSMLEIAQPPLRLVENVPSRNLRSLKRGLLASRNCLVRVSSRISFLPMFKASDLTSDISVTQ